MQSSVVSRRAHLQAILDGDGTGGDVEEVAVREVRRHPLVALFVQNVRVDQRAVRIDDRRAEHHSCTIRMSCLLYTVLYFTTVSYFESSLICAIVYVNEAEGSPGEGSSRH